MEGGLNFLTRERSRWGKHGDAVSPGNRSPGSTPTSPHAAGAATPCPRSDRPYGIRQGIPPRPRAVRAFLGAALSGLCGRGRHPHSGGPSLPRSQSRTRRPRRRPRGLPLVELRRICLRRTESHHPPLVLAPAIRCNSRLHGNRDSSIVKQ